MRYNIKTITQLLTPAHCRTGTWPSVIVVFTWIDDCVNEPKRTLTQTYTYLHVAKCVFLGNHNIVAHLNIATVRVKKIDGTVKRSLAEMIHDIRWNISIYYM